MISFPAGLHVRMVIVVISVVAGSFLYAGCSGESDEMVRKKLEVICAGDLAALTDSIAGENLIERPHYSIVFYKKYPEGGYTFKAVVDFKYLKKVHVKVVRKYRYHASVRMWDRYSNDYVFLHDSSAADQKK